MDLKEKIFNIIKESKEIQATTIATKLSITKQEVNSILYSKNGLKSRVKQNKKYEWSVEGASSQTSSFSLSDSENNTKLTKISKYFLDCLVYDADYGISTFQESNFNDLDYAQISYLPNIRNCGFDDIFSSSEEAKKLLTKINRDKFRLGLYLGYPTSLRLHKGKKGWEGFFVEPLFLFPLQLTKEGGIFPSIIQSSPFINFSFLKKYQSSNSGNVIEESIQIFEELGLNENEEEPDIDDFFQRIQIIRPDWVWKEDINPHELSNKINLKELSQEGIYNKAVLINGERSPYTHGLENELNKLAKLNEKQYEDTSLGYLVNSKYKKENLKEIDRDLIEVVPLNSEQRNAVTNSLHNPLTVITGPPGTGKSQVVSSILINAAWRGKKVLFASKNNKAVDVVEERVNGISNRPILLRHGSSKYQSKLVSYLIELLSTKAEESDRSGYKDALETHMELNQKRKNIDIELNKIIKLRNKVDKLEQSVEETRINLGDDFFYNFKDSASSGLIDSMDFLYKKFNSDLDACKKPTGFFKKLLWDSEEALNELKKTTKQFQNQFFSLLGINFIKKIPTEENLEIWHKLNKELKEKIISACNIRLYFENLFILLKNKKAEEFNNELKNIIEEISTNSESLWRKWLKLQSDNLDQNQRKLLNDYSTILNLIITSDETGDKIDKKIWAKYYQIFPEVANLLPCWAVTSLSAGKIPFIQNFFDILVIDEASQCDIASVLPLLYRAKHLVVIGDPKQLNHITTLRNKQDQQLMHRYNVFDDFLQWSYSQNSLFDLSVGYCASEDIINLRDHHRSHSQIIDFSNKFFYQGYLRVATKYENLVTIDDKKPAVRWINCIGETSKPLTGGAFNIKEAIEVVNQIKDLIFIKKYKGTIGVVSPFRLQVNKIRELIFEDDKLLESLNHLKFLCDTVHKFQGDERDLMIFSPVVSKNISIGALAFLKSNGNLFNVAITRARSTLIVIGDLPKCLDSGIDYLSSFAEYVSKLKIQDEKKEKEINQDYGIDYPSVSNPEQVSDWEKVFYKALYKKGIKTIPQYNIDKYILDMAIIKNNKKLNIEVDGERYHKDWNGELLRKDRIRNQRMFELGWDVMRFWVYEIRDNLDDSVNKVHIWLENKN